MQKMIVYIIRHGESFRNIGNYEEKSSSKVDLTETGIQQARQLSQDFQNIHFDKIYSSDYVRAYKTAQFLAQGRNMEIIVDSSIQERHFGEIYRNSAIKTKDEMIEIFKKLNDEEKFNYSHYSDMETARSGAERLQNFLLKISKTDGGKVVAVVCHGNIMRSFLNLIGWAKFSELPEGSIGNTGFLKMEIENNFFKVLETSKIEVGPEGNRIM